MEEGKKEQGRRKLGERGRRGGGRRARGGEREGEGRRVGDTQEYMASLVNSTKHFKKN